MGSHLSQTFIKMWKMTFADLLVIRADDLPTVKVPYTRLFDFLALIERAFYKLRPEIIAVMLLRPKQQMTDIREYDFRFEFADDEPSAGRNADERYYFGDLGAEC